MRLLPIVGQTASLVPLLEIGSIIHHKTCMCKTGRFACEDIDERQFVLVVLLARNKMNNDPVKRKVADE
jgi:hypothetical protein